MSFVSKITKTFKHLNQIFEKKIKLKGEYSNLFKEHKIMLNDYYKMLNKYKKISEEFNLPDNNYTKGLEVKKNKISMILGKQFKRKKEK